MNKYRTIYKGENKSSTSVMSQIENNKKAKYISDYIMSFNVLNPSVKLDDGLDFAYKPLPLWYFLRIINRLYRSIFTINMKHSDN